MLISTDIFIILRLINGDICYINKLKSRANKHGFSIYDYSA